ncbi:ATP-binding protein, partial [Escherichia coli]
VFIRPGTDEQPAFARKPAQHLAASQEKIAVTRQLTLNVDMNLSLYGRQPADELLQASLRAIQAALS